MRKRLNALNAFALVSQVVPKKSEAINQHAKCFLEVNGAITVSS